MIYPATQEIYDVLTENELKCGIEERDELSVVHLGITSKETSYEIQYISRREENDVSMRIYNLLKFPQEKMGAVLAAVNHFNVALRFFKFNVDVKGLTIDLEYDFPLETLNIGQTAMEMLHRSADVIDRSYPELMKVVSG